MKYRLAVALFLGLLPASGAAPYESLVQVSHTYHQLEGIRVRLGVIPLVWPEIREVTSYGSGTVVRSEGGYCWVLTCWHVCEFRDGRHRVITPAAAYDAEWLGVDGLCDLCLLRIKANLPAAELADKWPDRGSRVYIYGHEGGRAEQTFRQGEARGPSGRDWVWTPFGPMEIGQTIYWISQRPEPGASGCGVLDGSGRLVGVLWGRPAVRGSDPRGEGLVVGLPDVKRFLDSFKGK